MADQAQRTSAVGPRWTAAAHRSTCRAQSDCWMRKLTLLPHPLSVTVARLKSHPLDKVWKSLVSSKYGSRQHSNIVQLTYKKCAKEDKLPVRPVVSYRANACILQANARSQVHSNYVRTHSKWRGALSKYKKLHMTDLFALIPIHSRQTQWSNN